jgi:hypothetical protein
MITKNMQDFINKNKTLGVVYGEVLTPEGNTVHTSEDIARSDRTLYRFEDGTTQVLTREDKQSAPDFTTDWRIV